VSKSDHLASSKLARALVMVGGVLGCSTPPAEDPIPIGLMLSFSGVFAANSANSERALLMAVDAANEAGGVAGRRLRVVARDTRSDVAKVTAAATDLIDAGAAVIIGPDTTDLVTQLRPVLQDRTMILPSYATASAIEWKPASWFVMGPAAARVACELVAQLRADSRQSPLVIVNPSGYNSWLAWEFSNRYGMVKHILPTDEASTTATVRPLTGLTTDAFVLAALPTSASSLMYALSSIGALDPSRWYLSPTLHTPAFLASIPKGLLKGAHGVSAGTVAGAADFATEYKARWQDPPLDDAYPFYDAGAVAILAIGRAIALEGAIPSGSGLSKHIQAVTRAGGMPIAWNKIGRGLEALRAGAEIQYFGLSGVIEFDASGQSPAASTNWWAVGDSGFMDVTRTSTCR
jgi:ABC-type branched-subunit amino acid transport system substrate-binding protein